MLKALFLDMDETLCDTQAANEQAKQLMARDLEVEFGDGTDGRKIAEG